MALAVHAAQLGHNKALVRNLLITIFLACCFLFVKGLEYHQDLDERLWPGPHFKPGLPPQAQIFWFLYWAMTGLHALHVTVGVGVLSVIARMASRGRFSPKYYNPVDISALYWHFVDIVWIWLYPLLYLIDRHQ
jgi:cytochrome c oxidase subunit 3